MALVIFTAMGIFISLLAEQYRRNQRSLAAYKTERDLWVSREKLAVAMASMADAVFISDLNHHVVDFNDAFVTFHRYCNRAECSRDLADYADLFEVSLPNGSLVPEKMWSASRALRGETATNIEYNLRRKDTGETWVGSYSFSPLRDSNGLIIGAVVVARDVTEQKAAEQRLRDSERDLSLIYRDMHDVLFFLSVAPGDQFRFISVNPAFQRATGLDISQIVGKLVQEVIPEPSIGLVLERYKEAVLGRKTVFWEETTAYPAGEKHGAVSVSPVFDARGVCTNLIGIVHDVTERWHAERHIEQLNRVYSVLSDINQTIVRTEDTQEMLEAACRTAVEKGNFVMAWVGMIDPATQMIKPVAYSGANDGYLDQLKVDLHAPVTAAGPAARSILTGEHALCNDIEHDPLYSPWRDEALRRGYRSSAGLPLKIDGRTVGVFNLYACEPGYFVDDEMKLLDEMAMDISFALEVNRREEDRRKAEEELHWRTAFFEAQVDSALDGILVVDSQGKKILQNQRLNDLMKIPKDIYENPDDTQQVHFVKTIVKNSDQFVEKVNYLYSYPEKVSRDEIELLDGTILDRYSSPVRDKAGNYYGRIWTFRDITGRRQLEEQFRQAQKMEAIGQLTGGIAHDFNNLLTVILGCSEVIAEEVKESPRLRKIAGMILGAARRGADLTHRMLAFARRQTLQPRPVDVNQLILNFEGLLRHTLKEAVELNVNRDAHLWKALVDPAQLESALLNLCVNSQDAMPGGGILTIETCNTSLDRDYANQNSEVEPGQYVLVSVTDTGAGIQPEIMGRVFEPFFTTKEAGKGTGLGLSMVYGFIKQSHGHVKIYSEPGIGTTVRLYLPRAEQTGGAVEEVMPSTTDLRGTEVILLVEDDALVRDFASAQLSDLGYRVLEAANGKDALKMIREHEDIDLLFTDVVMPGGMNGRELAHEASKLRPALNALYTSGYAESARVHQGLLDKDVRLLSKPYGRLELAKEIRRALMKR